MMDLSSKHGISTYIAVLRLLSNHGTWVFTILRRTVTLADVVQSGWLIISLTVWAILAFSESFPFSTGEAAKWLGALTLIVTLFGAKIDASKQALVRAHAKVDCDGILGVFVVALLWAFVWGFLGSLALFLSPLLPPHQVNVARGFLFVGIYGASMLCHFVLQSIRLYTLGLLVLAGDPSPGPKEPPT